ncbi:hypothetical protein [cyanobacterium endosymbiont of Epithemia clementina EcSB]|nr:hypothetical protein [cyanobacterium endosymbiont of Epithemia clementina EcSB]WGT66747.1 hypothetical protein P3F56_05655 [cyanobacterium endosymbiont of Epithemia clementina EcSB]
MTKQTRNNNLIVIRKTTKLLGVNTKTFRCWEQEKKSISRELLGFVSGLI